MQNSQALISDDVIISSLQLADELKNIPEEKRFSFGHDLMDRYLHEIARGDFIIIGGRAGQGKSQFCVSLTRNFSKQGILSLWFSIEMPPKEFIGRFGSDIPMFFVPRKIKMPTMAWIEKKIDDAIKDNNVSVVFLDHIGMIVDEDVYRSKSGLEIFDERLKVIKSWAVNKNIVIVGISPVKQESSATKNKELTLGDYRGSSMVGHTADLALMITRVSGKSKEVILNDILEDDFDLRTETDVSILKCRRSGLMKAKIRMEMDTSGNFHEM